ncbi:fukutin-related protein-like [Elysia marginata]|uniref:Fukutin-related protein-like n=1 Tax=Elysia marginata TaxID=1093978 RepID=A0AAV4JTN0_9GAST|nr:fukutin-related protein-like [Elysia marginata]
MIFPRKLRKRKGILAILLTMLIMFFFYLFKSLPEESSSNTLRHVSEDSKSKAINKQTLKELLSIIILDFEDFENALAKTTDAIHGVLGDIPIFIISNRLPYPPLELDQDTSAHIVTLENDLSRNHSAGCMANLIKTEFVLFLPDASSLEGVNQIKSFLAFLQFKRVTKAVAIPQVNEVLQCTSFSVDLKRWSITYGKDYLAHPVNCPLVKGNHGLLVRTEAIQSLPMPFTRPFPLTFYVQAKLKGWNVRIMKSGQIGVLSKLYTDPHLKWKRKKSEADHLRKFYQSVGLKQETLPSGISQYYGCDKHSPRCFGTVVKDMPRYLYEGRWTPPCCLRALRETAAHVFSVLEKCGVRYWLEGGTLLGAARLGDIIPWDYDVDIGIYKEDITKCQLLQHASEGPEAVIDDQEFVWERANEGDFLRVQYSETNHLHVDIYPFYPKDGVMTKDTWFATHRQDVEFSESFLKPLAKINFTGRMVSAPNNVKKFLEYKFGKGVIENPRYPNLRKPV